MIISTKRALNLRAGWADFGLDWTGADLDVLAAVGSSGTLNLSCRRMPRCIWFLEVWLSQQHVMSFNVSFANQICPLGWLQGTAGMWHHPHNQFLAYSSQRSPSWISGFVGHKCSGQVQVVLWHGVDRSFETVHMILQELWGMHCSCRSKTDRSGQSSLLHL